MDINKRAEDYTEQMLNEYIDQQDYYFYNSVDITKSPAERQLNRNGFIDGLAWSSALQASAIANLNTSNLKIVKALLVYHQNLNVINGHPGRFCRAYRKNGGGGKWIQSGPRPTYFFRDGQAKAGPVAFASAVAAALSNKDLPQGVREAMFTLYLEFVADFYAADYKILMADGAVSKHGDVSPSGFSGLINGHFVYAIMGLASMVAMEMGSDDIALKYSDAAKKAEPIFGASFVVGMWVLAMNVWDKLNRLVGKHRKKYSNDNLIYFLLSIWAYAPEGGMFSKDKLESMRHAAEKMHEMTETWHNPFFDGIYSKLTGKGFNYALDQMYADLTGFSTERRKSQDDDNFVHKNIVGIGERKPSSWAWRQNPYEMYVPHENDDGSTKLTNEAYSPADWLTAYNLYKHLGGK